MIRPGEHDRAREADAPPVLLDHELGAPLGLTMDLEPMPWTDVRSLQQGARIVDRVRPHVEVVAQRVIAKAHKQQQIMVGGVDGLVHVSQISNDRVEKVSDVLKEGDIVKVKVLEVDKQGRIRLSMKAVEEGEGGEDVGEGARVLIVSSMAERGAETSVACSPRPSTTPRVR